jgi:hypothetical protein
MPSSGMGRRVGLVNTDVSEERIHLFYTGRGDFFICSQEGNYINVGSGG